MRIVSFKVHGPVAVDTTRMRAGGKIISEHNGDEFWKRNEKNSSLKGCFIFAVAYGRKLTPWYVGMTARGFGREAFSAGKINRYNEALAESQKGKPQLFFVECMGRHNRRAIQAAEKYLIGECKKINASLKNRTNVKPRKWEIDGVTRQEQRRPTKSSQALRKMLDI